MATRRRNRKTRKTRRSNRVRRRGGASYGSEHAVGLRQLTVPEKDVKALRMKDSDDFYHLLISESFLSNEQNVNEAARELAMRVYYINGMESTVDENTFYKLVEKISHDIGMFKIVADALFNPTTKARYNTISYLDYVNSIVNLPQHPNIRLDIVESFLNYTSPRSLSPRYQGP